MEGYPELLPQLQLPETKGVEGLYTGGGVCYKSAFLGN